MSRINRLRLSLIVFAILVLAVCIAFSAYLLFSNYSKVHLLREAERNFQQGKLDIAEAQFRQLIREDSDNERAFILLGEIAEKLKKYPDMVYYCYQAHELNPLSEENKDRYIKSLLYVRDFPALERVFAGKPKNKTQRDILLYSAVVNGHAEMYKEFLTQTRNEPHVSGLQKLLHILDSPDGFEAKRVLPELADLEKTLAQDEIFLRQEIAAAEAGIYFQLQDIDKTEAALKKAYGINDFVFAAKLGNFYANYRSLGQALEVFEKYLKMYHDPIAALQTAEIYCLLGKRDKIADLRKQYQSDSGKTALVCTYYFDALDAFAGGDLQQLKQFLQPLRHSIKSPLALFIYLCAEIDDKNYPEVLRYYNELLALQPYLDLQERADRMVLDLIKANADMENADLMLLAEKVNSRIPNVFAAKYILLGGHHRKAVDSALLRQALDRYPDDPGILKIAIEYYLQNKNTVQAEQLIADYEKRFPAKTAEMLRYKIISAIHRRNPDKVSALFQKNFSPEVRAEYWAFASSAGRMDDLRFLAKDELYKPFCQAAILLLENKKDAALDLLVKADAKGNLPLLFYAARTLAENGRTAAAFEKYALFPENSPYKIVVLLNQSELYADMGNLPESLRLAKLAYQADPTLPETQLCYGDKLRRSGHLAQLTDVVQMGSTSQYSQKLKELWIIGMEEKLRLADNSKDNVRLLELCDKLLLIDPGNRMGKIFRAKAISAETAQEK